MVFTVPIGAAALVAIVAAHFNIGGQLKVSTAPPCEPYDRCCLVPTSVGRDLIIQHNRRASES